MVILGKAMLKLVLPLACSWAEQQERLTLNEGVPLTKALQADARRAAVAHPERVRLRVVEQMPMPLHPLLRESAESLGLISPFTAGLALRYGILIRSDCWGDRRLVVHELAHTAQYERLGGFEPFLSQYLLECITPPGYPYGPLEQEAKNVAEAICPDGIC